MGGQGSASTQLLAINLSWEILAQVSTQVTAATTWAAIEGMFASQSHAHIISTRMVLATGSKGTSSINKYFSKMKGLADAMPSAGRKLEDEKLVSYILIWLDLEFNPVMSAVQLGLNPSRWESSIPS